MFITSPSHSLYSELKDVTDNDIQRKIAGRNSAGIWDISWNWKDYPDAFAISANWWKANLAIRNLLILKHFEQIEG